MAPSFLNSSGLLHEANKPALADAIWVAGKRSDEPLTAS